MKKIISFLLLISSLAGAQTTAVSELYDTLPAGAQPHQYEVGLKLSQFEYTEPKMKDSGQMSGLSFKYLYQYTRTSLFRLDGEYLTGSLTYDGHYMSGTPVKMSGEKFRTMELESSWINYTSINPDYSFAPYYGFGIRNTFDDHDSSSDYRRVYDYYTLHFGGQWEFEHSSKTSSFIRASFHYLIGGSNKTYWSDVEPGGPDFTFKFSSGNAMKLGYEVYSTDRRNGKFAVGINYAKWSIARSSNVISGSYVFYEPENKTEITSLSLGYLF